MFRMTLLALLVLLAMIAGVDVLLARIAKEDAMMIERFGTEYNAYKKRAGCLPPRL